MKWAGKCLIIVGACFFTSVNHAWELRRQTFLTALPTPSAGFVKVAGFDADSTLRVSRSGMPWATHSRDYLILANVAAKIRELNQQGYIVAIFSNQGRIPHSITMEEADRAIYNLIQDLSRLGALVHYYDFAEKVDEYRKPAPGMFYRLEQSLRFKLGDEVVVRKDQSMMVGDAGYTREDRHPDGRVGGDFSNADRRFAENVGIRFEYAPEYFGWTSLGIRRMRNRFDLYGSVRRMLQMPLGLAACRQLLTAVAGGIVSSQTKTF